MATELELTISANAEAFNQAVSTSSKALVTLTDQINKLNKTFSNNITSMVSGTKKLEGEFDVITGQFKKAEVAANDLGKTSVKVEEEYKKSFFNIGSAAKDLIKVLAVTFSLHALIDETKKAVAEFGEFEEAMDKVRSRLNESAFGAEGLENGFKRLTRSVLELSARSPQSLDQISKGLLEIVKAGVPVEKSLDTLQQGLKLATAGAADPSVAIGALTTIIKTYGLSLDELEPLTAKFFKASTQGKLDVEGLSGAIGNVASISGSFGIKIEQVLGALSTLSTSSGNAAEASTKLEAIYRAIIKPSQTATDEAKKLGIAFDGQALRSIGLVGIMTQLRNAHNLTADSVTRLFGRVEAITAASSLLGVQYGQLKRNTKDLGDEQDNLNTLNKAQKINIEGVNDSLKILANSFTALAISIVGNFEPQIKSLTTTFDDLNKRFLDSGQKGLDFTTALIKVTAATIATTAAVRGLAFVLGVSAGGWVAVAAGVAGVVVGLSSLNPVLDETNAKIKEQVDLNLNNLGIQKRALEQQISLKKEQQGYDGSDGFKEDQKNLSNINQEIQKYLDQSKELQTTGQVTPRFPERSPVPFQQQGEALSFQGQTQTPLVSEGQVDETLSMLKKYEEDRNQIAKEGAASRAEIAQSELDDQGRILREETEAEKNIADYKLNQAKEDRKIMFESDLSSLEDEYNQKLISEETFQKELQQIQLNAAAEKIQIRQTEVKNDRQLEENLVKEKTAIRTKERQQILKDTQNSNKTLAEINAFNRTEEFKASQEALGNLASLTQSKNKELFAVGKAASIAQAIINTYVGATRAMAEVPPPFGEILAGTVIAAGFVQVDNIRRQEFQGANQGMFVEGGQIGVDTVPVMLSKGELVVPRQNFEEVIAGVTASRRAKEIENFQPRSTISNEEIPINVTVGFTQNAFDLIEAEIVQRRQLNTARI